CAGGGVSGRGVRVWFIFVLCYGVHRDLLSFPTRRSSDLTKEVRVLATSVWGGSNRDNYDARLVFKQPIQNDTSQFQTQQEYDTRSEEHTSELQSRENLVCRLLPERKPGSSSHSAAAPAPV